MADFSAQARRFLKWRECQENRPIDEYMNDEFAQWKNVTDTDEYRDIVSIESVEEQWSEHKAKKGKKR